MDRNSLSKEIGNLMREGKKEEAETTKAKVNEINSKLQNIEKEPEDILNDLGIDFFSIENPKNLVMNQKQIAAYLTGTFLAKGSINSPKSSSYHLELSFTDPSFAKWIQKLLTHYPFHLFRQTDGDAAAARPGI